MKSWIENSICKHQHKGIEMPGRLAPTRGLQCRTSIVAHASSRSDFPTHLRNQLGTDSKGMDSFVQRLAIWSISAEVLLRYIVQFGIIPTADRNYGGADSWKFSGDEENDRSERRCRRWGKINSASGSSPDILLEMLYVCYLVPLGGFAVRLSGDGGSLQA